jgi:hypothetical protein
VISARALSYKRSRGLLSRPAHANVAELKLAPAIREAVEDAIKHGDAERLRDSLDAFALSRVDSLQLAESQARRQLAMKRFPEALAAAG